MIEVVQNRYDDCRNNRRDKSGQLCGVHPFGPFPCLSVFLGPFPPAGLLPFGLSVALSTRTFEAPVSHAIKPPLGVRIASLSDGCLPAGPPLVNLPDLRGGVLRVMHALFGRPVILDDDVINLAEFGLSAERFWRCFLRAYFLLTGSALIKVLL